MFIKFLSCKFQIVTEFLKMNPFAYIQSFEVSSYYMHILVYIPDYFCTSNCLSFEEETVAYPVLS